MEGLERQATIDVVPHQHLDSSRSFFSFRQLFGGHHRIPPKLLGHVDLQERRLWLPFAGGSSNLCIIALGEDSSALLLLSPRDYWIAGEQSRIPDARSMPEQLTE